MREGDTDSKVTGRGRNKRKNEKLMITAFYSILNGFLLGL